MRKSRSSPSGYRKVSASLEDAVLRQIRERTENVSAFLNEAAKRKLYFDKLREADEELGRQGVEVNERFYGNLKAWIDEEDIRRVRVEDRRRKASAR